MSQLFTSHGAQLVVWLTVGLMITVLGIYFLRKTGRALGAENQTVDHLAGFREMKRVGVLNEKEFSAIKANLSGKIAKEVSEFREND